MSLADLETFLLERLAELDPNMDLTPGSPADVQVVQALLRRLGPDPYTVDLGTFLRDKINQEFPDAATREGDALTDLLIKAALVLWDPVIRENIRIRNNLSFRDPAVLTADEADALGANLFATLNRGEFARGVARVYFLQPQHASLSPANFFSSKSDLQFLPTEVQSLSAEEMLFNVEESLYYFDVNVIAQTPGADSNIEPDSLISVANLASAVRVTNKARFHFGVPAETPTDFIARMDRQLSERSLVTERGILAKVRNAFAEVSRLAVVGFGDAEMQRDVLTGGGLGPMLAGGLRLAVIADGENHPLSRRIRVLDPPDFTALLGPTGTVLSGFTLTVFDAFPPLSLPAVRDLTVQRVVDPSTLDLNEQVLRVGAAERCWSLRKQELRLSGMPGGILFPDSEDGTVSVPNQVHIGGATDILVRGATFDTATLVLTDVVDDTPALSGRRLRVADAGHVVLGDLVLGSTYAPDDATYRILAAGTTLSLQVMDPPSAGSFRITAVIQLSGQSPVLAITPAITTAPGAFRWRLLDEIDIDLREPKETKVTGSDLVSVQGQDTLDTAGGVDFSAYGVAPGDVVRIYDGAVRGDYNVTGVLTPLFRQVRVDRPLSATVSNLQYAVFRPNADGGLKMPFVRIASIELLDSSSQPIGTNVPFAAPVDIRSRGFANLAHGIKADVADGRLGIVSPAFPSGALDVAGLSLSIRWAGPSAVNVTFSGQNPIALRTLVDQINQASTLATGVAGLATVINGERLGLVPVVPGLVVDGGTALGIIFGPDSSYTASDIRSELASLTTLHPPLDTTADVAQVLDGLQIGFYGELRLTAGGGLRGIYDFAPEAGRRVQIGSRSIGSARLYFLEPTSIEFPANAIFRVHGPDGGTLDFHPDPTRTYQRIPALPSGTKPKDGSTKAGGSTLTTGTLDFVRKGIEPGDWLVLDYIPIIAARALPDPVPDLHTRSIVLSINGGLDKSVIFVHDEVTIPSNAVTRQGVADQINRIVGQAICRINASGQLEFEADAEIVIRASGSANALLGLPTTVDVNDSSPHQGTYTIVAVAPSQLTVDASFRLPSDVTRGQFRVLRRGLQRICATEMSTQRGTAGLYYFDIDLISEGSGDRYNIEADLPMTASGYNADGYSLSTADPNLSFSELEQPRLHLSRSILEIGVSDDPENATELSGQNAQIHYERSALTSNVQTFAIAETERVVNESTLVRHLVPYFVRLDLSYVGGSQASIVTADIRDYIQKLYPNDALTVSALEKIVLGRGASSVTNPLDLIAVIHNFDRTISVERSRDRLNTGHLAAFVPDVLNIARRLS
ncbi:hypothetical protein LVJ94_34550 [Pendulispora rubella]|uniref:Baseplate protein J-like domain-containing protein n=1 Tax=Pendulispora rubella TaxID=2741070 RepID=A0ABZ2KVA8_9BACT